MSLITMNYYLMIAKFTSLKVGNIITICEKVITDFEKGTNIAYNISILNSCMKIPDLQVNNIIKIKKDERIYALKMILDHNNLYFPKAENNFLAKNINNNNVKYYLAPVAYNAWVKGSIFAVSNNTIYEFDAKNGGVINDQIPRHWIELTKDQKTTLIGKKRAERIQYYNSFLKNAATTSVGVNLTKISNPISIAKEPEVAIVANSIPKNEFFESTAFVPNTSAQIKNVHFKDWVVEEKVYFILIESGCRYEGTLKWLGSINDVNAAAVDLISSNLFDPLLMFRCSKEFVLKLNLSGMSNLVLIRLTTIRKSLANYDLMAKYFVKMYSSLGDSTLTCQIYNDAEQLCDSSFLDSLVNNCPQSFLFDLCLKLIPRPTKDTKLLAKLTELITRMPSIPDVNLLSLAKLALVSKKRDLFIYIIGKCTDVNIHLNSGETFLTDLIKDNASENILKEIIERKIFDINKPNKLNESPLTLACSRLLVKSVRLLVDSDCNIQFDNNKALEISFAAKKTASTMDQMKKVIDLIEILANTASKSDINICTICMDKKINIVFDCGHNSCKTCAEKLDICHFCKKRITNFSPLYLV